MTQTPPPDDHALDLDGPWRIGEDSFAQIVAELKPLNPKVIVEFGSGASSIRLAMAFPDAHIFAIDHDSHYFGQTRALHKRYPRLSNLDVEHRPLAWQTLHGGLFYTYQTGPFPGPVDAVLIDGPPRIYLNGREACLYQIWDQLRLGGRVYLDDAARTGELRALSNWSWRYGDEMGEAMRIIEGRHHVAVFEKRRKHLRARANARLTLESALLSVRNVRDAIRRRGEDS